MKAALAPGVHLACMSTPRGNGKSRLAAFLVERLLTPSDPLFQPSTESVLCAASIEQARIVARFARATLEPLGGYRFLDSATRVAITHVKSNTRLRVIGSNGKTAMGLVGCPWAICDEPGSWTTVGGSLLFDAIETAKGKPNSPLRSLYVGTLAPSMSGWWHSLALSKSGQGRAIMCLQGRPDRWDQWSEIKRVNPLTRVSPEFRKQLRGELAAAVPSIYCIGPPNDGSVFRNGHQIDLVDFAIDHEQASPCSFCRFVPANTVQGHAGAGSVQVAAERN